jgi:DNA (cytosine-5)-methyltransferase 1
MFSYVRAAWDQPAQTILKSITFGGCSTWHPDGERAMSGRELARLQSFPDQFQFPGSFEDWVARIGNSVPPLMMRAIAQHIRDHILMPTADIEAA